MSATKAYLYIVISITELLSVAINTMPNGTFIIPKSSILIESIRKKESDNNYNYYFYH